MTIVQMKDQPKTKQNSVGRFLGWSEHGIHRIQVINSITVRGTLLNDEKTHLNYVSNKYMATSFLRNLNIKLLH